MKINNFEIKKDGTFIIAEIGNNHNGDVDRAINMIDLAIKMNVNCVKFQMRNLNEIYRSRTLNHLGEDLGTEYILDLLKRFELSTKDHKKIYNYCVQNKITYMCTPWDLKSVSTLENFGVSSYKVSSADLTNMKLLSKLLKTKKPLIISTGMSNIDEIEFTTNFLKKNNANFALLHCNSTYPAPLHDINLKWMKNLKKYTQWIGYSGHERGINVSLAAVALGASIIERHFTLDRKMEGPDHAASLNFNDFKLMINGIREIEKAMGSGDLKQVSQGEMINKENLGKSLVSSKAIKKGTTINKSHIDIKSPGKGLSVQYYEKLIGTKIYRNMDKEEFFYKSDINGKLITSKNYKFRRPWGVPVRYHDIESFTKLCNPDLWEFHLSYSDMNLNHKLYINKNSSVNYTVHAPELFENSQLMDLASIDLQIRNNSIKKTQRVINLARELKQYFPQTQCPLIICNIGGFSMDAPLNQNEKNLLYKNFSDSLKSLDMIGVEIIPQTMAPFPWHFGGQRYQNLFILDNEIIDFCKNFNMRVCLDVSHSMLASNHLNFDFYKFVENIAPFTAHIHIGDAKGLNGEGLQIGDGEINFSKLGKILDQFCPHASFIPEIWQGHKNNGESFWIALEKLESYF